LHLVYYNSHYYFFFQAEDGIRDSSVTGVQTCALPIYQRDYAHQFVLIDARNLAGRLVRTEPLVHVFKIRKDVVEDFLGDGSINRSEERRVGKECRFRWLRCL